MNRTLGFFLGSAAVFVLLVYVIGQPVDLAPPDRQVLTESDPPALSAVERNEAVVTTSPPIPEPGERSENSATGQSQAPVTAAQSIPEDEIDENMLAESFVAGSAVDLQTPDQSGPIREMPASGQSEAAVNSTEISQELNAAEQPVMPGDANAMTAATQAAQQQWYPIWDPFHSELSANAFARRLERVTGLDYRVFKVSAANYRVAVGYASEQQRELNVAAIEEATGLSITGGSL